MEIETATSLYLVELVAAGQSSGSAAATPPCTAQTAALSAGGPPAPVVRAPLFPD